MKFLLITFGILCFSFTSLASSSMRRCTLLPVTDSLNGAVGYKVFEAIENKLKESDWCSYVSNSDMLNVFSRYRDNLAQYIKTKEVLTTVGNKLKVGSLIVVNLKYDLNGVEVELNIYGDNGEDLYFSENKVIPKEDIEKINELIIGWLEIYSKSIPYDATVIGILGDQITLDVSSGDTPQIGQNVIIKRVENKKKHPLLKKIVDWETRVVALARVIGVSGEQAYGVVNQVKSDKKIVIGDWVRFEESPENKTASLNVENETETSPGTLGVLSIGMFGSSSSVDIAKDNSSARMTGIVAGLNFRGEAWITREYFASLELEGSLGQLRKSSGQLSKSGQTAGQRLVKLTGGYKYLPLGFFYGPQIDFYGGYSARTFDQNLSKEDGLGRNSITGLVVGAGVNLPIVKDYRVFGRAEVIPFPTFRDDDNIYGDAKAVTSLDLEFGLSYQYSNRITLDGKLEFLSNKAKFNGEFEEISYKDNRLILGASFNF